MKKLFIHPKALPYSVETDFLQYKKFVPLTRDNLEKNFSITNSLEDCDYIFLGQITENMRMPEEFVNICEKYSRKVIVDIEGDFGSNLFHPCFKKVITCAGGPDKKWQLKNCFVRPHLSRVLIELYEKGYSVTSPDKKQFNFVFQGQINVLNRIKMVESILELEIKNYRLKIQKSWGANKTIQESDYCSNLNDNLLSLCPRGVGGSSIRLYESCFFGCVPIILGTDQMMAEDTYDTSFAFKLEDYENKESIKQFIKKINDTPRENLINMGMRARKYYNEVVSTYLKNPFEQFQNWINTNGL